MKMFRLVKEGTRALGARKLRTFFMMLGTIVGITALTVIMAIGAGTEREVMNRVKGFGFRAIIVSAGGGRGPLGPRATTTTLREEDVEAVRDRVSGIEAMSPTAMKVGVSIKRGAAQTNALVFAIEPDWHEAWEWFTSEGAPIEAEDMASLARVCVLGTSVSRELFGEASPIGEYVQIGNVRFLVKGVLESRGTSPVGSDFDNRALVPLTTGLRRLFNQDYLSQIRILVEDPDQLEPIGEQVRKLLRERHHITPPEEDDFRVRTAADVARMVRGVSGTMSTLLTTLAGLSLIVGGIVLMNILLISVNERTAEIGLRRAIGATRRDIFTQFLAESIAITSLGMLIGVGLGFGASTLVGSMTTMKVVISWTPFALGLGFSLMVGLFFGIQPARKAARLSPVQALR